MTRRLTWMCISAGLAAGTALAQDGRPAAGPPAATAAPAPDAVSERVRRAAENPMRLIIEASRIRRRAGDGDEAPAAAPPAAPPAPAAAAAAARAPAPRPQPAAARAAPDGAPAAAAATAAVLPTASPVPAAMPGPAPTDAAGTRAPAPEAPPPTASPPTTATAATAAALAAPTAPTAPTAPMTATASSTPAAASAPRAAGDALPPPEAAPAPVSPPPVTATAAAGAGTAERTGGTGASATPRLLDTVMPDIPGSAMRRAGWPRVVALDLTIERDGRVSRAALLGGTGVRALEPYLVSALSQWRYAPLPQATTQRVELVFPPN